MSANAKLRVIFMLGFKLDVWDQPPKNLRFKLLTATLA